MATRPFSNNDSHSNSSDGSSTSNVGTNVFRHLTGYKLAGFLILVSTLAGGGLYLQGNEAKAENNDQSVQSSASGNVNELTAKENTQSTETTAEATTSTNSATSQTSAGGMSTSISSSTNQNGTTTEVTVNGQTVEVPPNGNTSQIIETPNGNVNIRVDNTNGSSFSHVHSHSFSNQYINQGEVIISNP